MTRYCADLKCQCHIIPEKRVMTPFPYGPVQAQYCCSRCAMEREIEMSNDDQRIKLITEKAVKNLPPNVSIPRLLTLLLSWADLLEEKGVDVDGPKGLLQTMSFNESEEKIRTS